MALIENFVSLVAARMSLFPKLSSHASHKMGWLVAFALAVLAIRPCPGLAQSAPPAQAEKGVQILLLGTEGGPPLYTNRSEPSTLLIVDGRECLIDCGIGTMQQMLRAGIRSETIGTIFFTHLHPDHALGLVDVMGNDYWERHSPGAARTVNIYGPPQTALLVNDAVNYINVGLATFGPALPRLTRQFVAHEISKGGLVYQDDKIRVIAVENTHYVKQKRARYKSYSYRFETPYGVIVFTGDTGPCDAVTRLAKGADVLIAEASNGDGVSKVKSIEARAKKNHWSPGFTRRLVEHFTLHHLDEKEVGEMATRAQVKAVILHHFDHEYPAHAAGVKKYYSGPVFAGADLEWFSLSPGTGLKRIPKGSSPATDDPEGTQNRP